MAHQLTNEQKSALKIRQWRKKGGAVAFVRECFGIEPDDWQVDFLNAYQDNSRVCAKSSKGPGKTAVLSWCCWHFMVCYLDAKIVATSISGDNLRDGLWAEMAKWQAKSVFLKNAFTWQKERIVCNDHPETWFMSARKWSQSADKDQQANTLAGLHADNIMFVVDEAGGVPDAVVSAAEAALANAGTEVNPDAVAKLLMAGNPTHLSGPLYRACTKERSYWHIITITSDPDNPKRSKRVSIEWARKQIASSALGREDPWVMINVLGEFPPQSVNALLGPDDMEKASKRVIPIGAYKDSARILGVDVACDGDDATVIFPRQGLVMFKPIRIKDPNLVSVAGRVAECIKKWSPDAVFIDATGGFGKSVVDNLIDWGHDGIVGVKFSESATDPQFVNIRAQMAFSFAGWVKSGGALPYVPELVEEATQFLYFHRRDRLQIIEKEQIKIELKRSPDYFDAAMLTFAYPVQKKNPFASALEASGVNYDPLSFADQRHGKAKLDDFESLLYNDDTRANFY